jgi:hypothetical protein
MINGRARMSVTSRWASKHWNDSWHANRGGPFMNVSLVCWRWRANLWTIGYKTTVRNYGFSIKASSPFKGWRLPGMLSF